MTMMISKFNKMIQSRLLWGVFLVIIIFSFVIWGTVTPKAPNDGNGSAAGMLNGEPISPSEYRSAYLSTYMARALTLGREFPSTPESDRILRRLSWQRLATLREAAKLGVIATDQELIGAIRGNFKDEQGAYSPERYQAFLQNIIGPMGFTTAQFEQHIREEIISQKMGMLIGRQATVTPLEIERTFETLLDTFTVEYATVSMEEVEKGVSITRADAKAAYEADPTLFTIPEQRRISYAAFPLADYMEEDAEVSEDDILDYYDLHIEDYTTEKTNEDGTPREEVADLETVREEIVAALRRAAALEKADEAASDLTFRAIPGRDGTIPDFAAEVEKSGLQLESLPAFSRGEVPLEDGGMTFTAMAFELDSNPYDRVSSPVMGETNAYVMYLEEVIEPRIPDFKEAREEAETMAKQQAVVDAVKAKALEVQEAAIEGLAKGKTFAEAVKGQGVEVDTEEEFTGLSGSSSTNPVVGVLVQSVVGYNQGEVTDPILTEGGLLVAYVKARTPADPASFDTYQGEIASAIRSRRAQGLFRDWQASLLSPEHFTDLQRPITDPDTLEEEVDIEVEEAVPADVEPIAAKTESL